MRPPRALAFQTRAADTPPCARAEKRKAEAERIRQKYPDRIPVRRSISPSRDSSRARAGAGERYQWRGVGHGSYQQELTRPPAPSCRSSASVRTRPTSRRSTRRSTSCRPTSRLGRYVTLQRVGGNSATGRMGKRDGGRWTSSGAGALGCWSVGLVCGTADRARGGPRDHQVCASDQATDPLLRVLPSSCT